MNTIKAEFTEGKQTMLCLKKNKCSMITPVSFKEVV